MKRIVLVSIFACAVGTVSLHAMEQEFPKKGREEIGEKKEPLEKRMYIQWGTITNETDRELKNIDFREYATFFKETRPLKGIEFTIPRIKPGETIKLFKGPIPITGRFPHFFAKEQNIEIPSKNNVVLRISVHLDLLKQNISAGTIIFLMEQRTAISSTEISNIDFNEKVNIQVNIILRDGPDGTELAGSYVELLAGQ